MMDQIYDKLNPDQKLAVDTIDGPVLVLAGPGTGKTQLLSARVMKILETTDTLPQNILCLTFTDTGAENMRQRLQKFIGEQAFKVNIFTFHGLAQEMIGSNRDYFGDYNFDQVADDISKYQLIESAKADLGYKHALSSIKAKSILDLISKFKQANFEPDDLESALDNDQQAFDQAEAALGDILSATAGNQKLAKVLPIYQQANQLLADIGDQTNSVQIANQHLAEALADADVTNSTKSLTAWRNRFFTKSKSNTFVFVDRAKINKLRLFAQIYRTYQQQLAERGLYDFDDMIISLINVLEDNIDFRYSLQEQYQFILADEYQDTNPSQARIIELLGDNPVNEGRPNIMVVGDDDQAIYAFQGADYSNMQQFIGRWRNVKLINLTTNYRSHADVLEFAAKIAGQIANRVQPLDDQNFTKQIVAHQASTEVCQIQRINFKSQAAERQFIAKTIKQLLDSGVAPAEIAVLAPKHALLTAQAGFLQAEAIPVSYEQKSNILDLPIVDQLVTWAEVILAADQPNLTNALFAKLISFDFWQIETLRIWRFLADFEQARTDSILTFALDSTNKYPKISQLAKVVIELNRQTDALSLNQMLDYLIGNRSLVVDGEDWTSPLKNQVLAADSSAAIELATALLILFDKLDEYAEQHLGDRVATLADLVAMVNHYRQLEAPINFTHPYAVNDQGVQLMTVFGAKGLEFEHVFLPSLNQATWQKTQTDKISLPPSLAHVRKDSRSDDDKLRLLFVAITRAKNHLYLTNHDYSNSGAAVKKLDYLMEDEELSSQLPAKYQSIKHNPAEAADLKALTTDWRSRHFEATTTAHDYLLAKMANYRLSPSDLTAFIDLEYGGPEAFYLNRIIGFPSQEGSQLLLGSAVHKALEWINSQTDFSDWTKITTDAVQILTQTISRAKVKFTADEIDSLIAYAEPLLANYLAAHQELLTRPADVEMSFYHENCRLGEADITGKIDRIEINSKDKTLRIIDFKTSKPETKWSNIAKTHNYRLQLYFYKILIECSTKYAGYRVMSGQIEFVEPDPATGEFVSLELEFDDSEQARIEQLAQAVFAKIKYIDIEQPDLPGSIFKQIKQFEQQLIDDFDTHG